MNELRIVEVSSLSNKMLVKSLSNVNKAILTGYKSGWTIAKEMNNIVNGETFKDDFKSAKDFADFIGVSKSTVSKMARVYDVYTAICECAGIKEFESRPMSFFMEMLPYEIDAVITLIRENVIKANMTVYELRETLKHNLSDLNVNTEVNEDTTEVNEDTTEVNEDNLVSFDFNGNKYTMPEKTFEKIIKELEAYIVR